METIKSLGVEENSSKLAISSCFTWTGSQSSMMNLEEKQTNKNARSEDSMLRKWKKYKPTRFCCYRGWACTCPCSPSKWLKCSAGIKWNESIFCHPTTSSTAWIIFWNVQYLCLWVRTKNLGSTLHWRIVVELLLDLLSRVWSTAVCRMYRLS